MDYRVLAFFFFFFVSFLLFFFYLRCIRPITLQLQQNLPTPIVIRKLRLQKRQQIHGGGIIGILDIVHPSIDIITGLFILGLLDPQFLLDFEVILLGLLCFGMGGVVG